MGEFNRDKAVEILRPFLGDEVLHAMGDAELKMALNKFPQLEKVMNILDERRAEFAKALSPVLQEFKAEQFVLFSMDTINDVLLQTMKLGGIPDEEIPDLMELLGMYPITYRTMLLRIISKLKQEV